MSDFCSGCPSQEKNAPTCNGTQGQLVQIKLKENPPSYQWEIWDNEKVRTVCVSDVEYTKFQHHPKTHETESLDSQLEALREATPVRYKVIFLNKTVQSRRFKL